MSYTEQGQGQQRPCFTELIFKKNTTTRIAELLGKLQELEKRNTEKEKQIEEVEQKLFDKDLNDILKSK